MHMRAKRTTCIYIPSILGWARWGTTVSLRYAQVLAVLIRDCRLLSWNITRNIYQERFAQHKGNISSSAPVFSR